jgi:hypothetical protein
MGLGMMGWLELEARVVEFMVWLFQLMRYVVGYNVSFNLETTLVQTSASSVRLYRE